MKHKRISKINIKSIIIIIIGEKISTMLHKIVLEVSFNYHATTLNFWCEGT